MNNHIELCWYQVQIMPCIITVANCHPCTLTLSAFKSPQLQQQYAVEKKQRILRLVFKIHYYNFHDIILSWAVDCWKQNLAAQPTQNLTGT